VGADTAGPVAVAAGEGWYRNRAVPSAWTCTAKCRSTTQP